MTETERLLVRLRVAEMTLRLADLARRLAAIGDQL